MSLFGRHRFECKQNWIQFNLAAKRASSSPMAAASVCWDCRGQKGDEENFLCVGANKFARQPTSILAMIHGKQLLSLVRRPDTDEREPANCRWPAPLQ